VNKEEPLEEEEILDWIEEKASQITFHAYVYISRLRQQGRFKRQPLPDGVTRVAVLRLMFVYPLILV
jgi:hypothetical protein